MASTPKHSQSAVASAAPQQGGYAAPPAYGEPAQSASQPPYANAPVAPVGAPTYAAQGSQGFDNARRGIKTLFHAQVIMLVSAAITFVLALFSIGAGYAGAGNLATGLLGATGIAGIATSIIILVAFIMRLVGLFRASKDEKTFLWAFIASLATVVLGVITGILAYQAVSNFDYGLVDGINAVSTLSTFLTLAVYLLIFFGIVQLAKRMGRSQVASTALVMLAISAVAYLLASFLPVSSYPIYFFKLICALLPDILLLVILSKANKMFA